jgi:hypothetical protein
MNDMDRREKEDVRVSANGCKYRYCLLAMFVCASFGK